ncbi:MULTISPECIES: ketopantoate reductase family protein [Myroides]|uniref:2-dehydropantoate 2-reductase n=1 Tax=Myroides albus TaxID=2562892 RepID=A0A6I3LFS6_9FLAO|nr:MULTISPECIES: 2-dehydropantoate 2-reductase [Myroides]MTG98329.1 2-dehydropantoate 2-reductase [Myroides albus]MVX36086.1 2-dehydropantoate 2-reductase [Myroides sp. LoEW2-1]UVD79598.1 2-dehydropantoate 2-reductase [Myroides albus]
MKTRIAILGIGGVGGFYGGLLASYYKNDPSIEIIFVARGDNYQVISTSGIEVYTDKEKWVGKPNLVVDHIKKAGKLDYIILATKGYDLEPVISDLKEVVDDSTVILPLLNGVEAFELLASAFKEGQVWKGCTYIVTRLKEPGVVDNPSGRQRILFGLDKELTPQMSFFEKILTDAGINALATCDISREVWEKYILVSSSATATTYYNSCFGGVMEHHADVMHQLLIEISSLARAKGITLSADIVDVVEGRLKAIPYESTTSMHSDFLSGKLSNELGIMTGYIVKEAVKYGVEVPKYKEMFENLSQRTGEKYLK